MYAHLFAVQIMFHFSTLNVTLFYSQNKIKLVDFFIVRFVCFYVKNFYELNCLIVHVYNNKSVFGTLEFQNENVLH